MSSYSETCVDSNLLIRSVEDEPPPEIMGLWREWLRDKVMLHAPALLRYEVVNALHQMRKAGRLNDEDARAALDDALSRPIVLHEDEQLHARALGMATEYNLPAAYDAQYLALAERLGVEFWTTDGKLARAVEGKLPWVQLVS